MWQDGTYAPIENPYGWNRLTNVIYVDQPVGTGFSQGTPTAQNEVDVADQFMEFWKNFVDTFDLTGYKVYIVGESYAGMYVPYIASGMLDTNNTDYYNVSHLGRCICVYLLFLCMRSDLVYCRSLASWSTILASHMTTSKAPFQ